MIDDQNVANRTGEESLQQLAGGRCVVGHPRAKLIRERASPAQGVSLQPSFRGDCGSEIGRFPMDRFQQKTAIRPKKFSIRFEDVLQETWRNVRAAVSARQFGHLNGRSSQGPSLNFVFRHESQFLVEGSSLWSGVELEARNTQCVEIFDGFVQKSRSYTAAPVCRVHQYHANPSEPVFE